MKRGSDVQNYKIKISRSEHVQDDPLLNCSVYTEENSYNDCLQNEINDLAIKEIGCLPPLLTQDLSNMCNEKFNLSAIKDTEINSLLMRLNSQDWDSGCKIPCTRSKYTTRSLSEAKWPLVVRTFSKADAER